MMQIRMLALGAMRRQFLRRTKKQSKQQVVCLQGLLLTLRAFTMGPTYRATDCQ
jgi:hypothetical protein